MATWLTLILMVMVTLIVSIRSSAWYQRRKVREKVRVSGHENVNWCFVRADGCAFCCRDKPIFIEGGHLIGPIVREKGLFGHYPALRNQVFLK